MMVVQMDVYCCSHFESTNKDNNFNLSKLFEDKGCNFAA